MQVIETVAGWRKALDDERAHGRGVGLVPTMGYLHDGHASLIRRAASECDVVGVTIFVNPLQFGAGEDLESYPRDLDADVALATSMGAAYVFAPSVDEMYPTPIATTVSVGGLSGILEGAFRPGHFDGVATVVAKLFSQAGPCRAYFGEKDFQQVAVVRTMVADLNLPVEVIACPTEREDDGLARSSRNVYLTAGERAIAPRLYEALGSGHDRALTLAGTNDVAGVEAAMVASLADVIDTGALAVDYAVIVDAATLTRPTVLTGELRLLIAARLGRARLIDNIGVTL